MCVCDFTMCTLCLTNPSNIMNGFGECMLNGLSMHTSLRDLKDFWCTRLTPWHGPRNEC